MDGEKSEWLSHVHVAQRRRLELLRADVGRQVVDRSRLVAGREVDRVPLRPRAQGQGRQGPEGQRLAHPRGRRRGGGADRREGRRPRDRVVAGREDDRVPDDRTRRPRTRRRRTRRSATRAWWTARSKLTRLYVVPVEKDADGKRPVRKLTEGAMSLGNLAGPSEFAWSPDGRPVVFSHQPTPNIDDWPLADVSIVEVETAPRARAGRARARRRSDPIFSPDGRQVAFDQSNDPPTWRRRSRVAIVPVEGGTPRLLAETPDAQPDLVGWTKDGRIVFGETHRTVNRVGVLPVGGGRPDVREPGRRDGRRTVAERGGHARRVQHAGAGPRARAVLGAARALRARAGGEGAGRRPRSPTAGRRRSAGSPPTAREVEGLVTYPGRLRGRHARAAARGRARRPGRRLRPEPHGCRVSLSGGRLRGARLRRPAGEPARQQRLRLRVPRRQLPRLGRRRLPGHHVRRRHADREGRRRRGRAWASWAGATAAT